MVHADDMSAREELAEIAASLRAYLEWQQDTGAMGIPRKPRDPVTYAAAELPAASANWSAELPAPQNKDEADATALNAISVVSPVARRSIGMVEAEAQTCTKCTLAVARSKVVFSRGNPKASVCFVGEAPSAEEEAIGIPFAGPAGQLLDKMIGAMGLDSAKDVYVCTIVKCRPPDDRTPEALEIETCLPYLHEQLALVAPKVIVALGHTAVAGLLGTKLGITKMRGHWKLYKGRIPVMPTHHPMSLLQPSPQQAESKKQAWDDLQAVMKELGLPRKTS